MKKANNSAHKKDKVSARSKPVPEDDDMLDDYSFLDWSKAERGKYAKRFVQGTNLVLIEPDLIDLFPNSESVNRALRALAEVIRNAPPRARSRKATAQQRTR
jgi:hypothetical protein